MAGVESTAAACSLSQSGSPGRPADWCCWWRCIRLLCGAARAEVSAPASRAPQNQTTPDKSCDGVGRSQPGAPAEQKISLSLATGQIGKSLWGQPRRGMACGGRGAAVPWPCCSPSEETRSCLSRWRGGAAGTVTPARRSVDQRWVADCCENEVEKREGGGVKQAASRLFRSTRATHHFAGPGRASSSPARATSVLTSWRCSVSLKGGMDRVRRENTDSDINCGKWLMARTSPIPMDTHGTRGRLPRTRPSCRRQHAWCRRGVAGRATYFPRSAIHAAAPLRGS